MERREADGKRFLRRPEHILAGQRVAVVDDVLTTGGSVRECIELVESIGAELCAVGMLVDRAGGSVTFPAPLVSLLSLKVEAFEADAMPDWLNAIPISRPGSTGKK